MLGEIFIILDIFNIRFYHKVSDARLFITLSYSDNSFPARQLLKELSKAAQVTPNEKASTMKAVQISAGKHKSQSKKVILAPRLHDVDETYSKESLPL